MLVRYRYRIDPTAGQRQALARAFGCARVVYNDALTERQRAWQAGQRLRDSEVQRRVITQAKRTPVAGLAGTRLAKSMHDAGWAMFVQRLEQKAAQHGRRLVKVGRWEPTSQRCSVCGLVDGPKPLNVRVWVCRACGTVHDRDGNAARNILVAAGLAETQNACGGSVSPRATLAVAGEAGTHRGAA